MFVISVVTTKRIKSVYLRSSWRMGNEIIFKILNVRKNKTETRRQEGRKRGVKKQMG